MARPTDWSAVDLPIDPVPGDAAEIRQSASGARSIEQAITEQVNRLNSLKDGEGWESESGTKFRDSAGDLAGAIEKAKGRYTQLAAALDDWANGLEGIQQEADAALARAQEARDAHRAAAGQTLTAAPDTPEHQDQVDAQDRAVDAAQSDIDAAKAIIFRLAGRFGEEGEYGDLASQVADRIRSGADDGLKDGWFDHVKQAIHDARGVLNVIKDALDFVSTFVMPVLLLAGVIFPAFMPIALAIGVAVSALSFGITALQGLAGDVSGGEVAKAAGMLALSAVGGAAGKLVTKAMPALRTAVAESGGLMGARTTAARGGSIADEASSFLRARSSTLDAVDDILGSKKTQLIGETPVGNVYKIHEIKSLAEPTEAIKKLTMPMSVGAWGQAGVGGIGAYDQLNGMGDLGKDLRNGWQDYWATKSEVHVGSL